MTTSSSKSSFEGALASPISGEALKSAQTSDEIDRAWNDIQLSWYEKTPLLLEHYGVSRDLPEEISNILLVHLLAQEFIPGFRIDFESKKGNKRGRPSTMPPKMLYDFMMLRQSGVGPADAVRRLNQKGPWKGQVPRGINARYSEHDRSGRLKDLAKKIESDAGTK